MPPAPPPRDAIADKRRRRVVTSAAVGAVLVVVGGLTLAVLVARYYDAPTGELRIENAYFAFVLGGGALVIGAFVLVTALLALRRIGSSARDR